MLKEVHLLVMGTAKVLQKKKVLGIYFAIIASFMTVR